MMSIYLEILTGLIIVSIILMGIGVAAQFDLIVKAASIIFCSAGITILFINILYQSSKETEKVSFEKGYKEAIMDCKGDSIDKIIIPN